MVSINPVRYLRLHMIMLLNRISGLPVIGDQGNLIGIVTEGDLLPRVETGTIRRRSRWLEFIVGPGQLASEYVQSHSRKVRDVITPNPEVIKGDTTIENIVLIMEKKRIKRLPVVEGDKLVGIVSQANLVQALATLSRELKDTIPGDKDIQERVLAEIEKQGWSSATAVNLIVRDGICRVMGNDPGREGTGRAVRCDRERAGSQAGKGSSRLGGPSIRHDCRRAWVGNSVEIAACHPKPAVFPRLCSSPCHRS